MRKKVVEIVCKKIDFEHGAGRKKKQVIGTLAISVLRYRIGVINCH
jgi:hypothetical protein